MGPTTDSDIAVKTRSRQRTWGGALLAPAVIVLAGLGAYCNSFHGAFVFDDLPAIRQNATIRSLRPIWQALSPPRGGETVSGRPLVNLTLALNYAISGLEVWSYHAFNLAVHILAGLALYGVVRRTLLVPDLRDRFGGSATFLALAVALIWTVHPLQTGSVTYIVQRAESMMGLFYLLTVYCFIRAACSPKAMPWYVLTVLACLLGLASKQVAATAPLAVLLYDRTFLGGSFKQALRKRWGLHLALAATWGLLAYLHVAAGERVATVTVSAAQYAAAQFGIVLHYLRLCFWPDPLCIDYGWLPPETTAELLPPLIIIAVLLLVTAWALVRRPRLGFAGAWFFLILAPTSSFIPLASTADLAFEHRMYLPLAGVAALVVIGACLLWRRWSPGGGGGLKRLVPIACLVLATGALAARTIVRNRDYQSQLAIWQATVDVRPTSIRGHYNLAGALAGDGKVDEAIEHYRHAVRLYPDYIQAHNNLAALLADRGRPEEAILHYEEALRLDPNVVEAHYNLALTFLQQGKLDGAVEHFKHALRLNPHLPWAHYNLASALAKQGKLDEAREEFRKAVAIKADMVVGHSDLGLALARKGELEDAVKSYRQALRLAGDNLEVCNNLAWLLATHPAAAAGDAAQAVELAEKVCNLTHRSRATYLDTLAAAYANAGRFDEAKAAAKEAIALAEASGRIKLAEEIKSRLARYEAGKPWREP
jgi:tetratricopeptide (TPR) repeat protein